MIGIQKYTYFILQNRTLSQISYSNLCMCNARCHHYLFPAIWPEYRPKCNRLQNKTGQKPPIYIYGSYRPCIFWPKPLLLHISGGKSTKIYRYLSTALYLVPRPRNTRSTRGRSLQYMNVCIIDSLPLLSISLVYRYTDKLLYVDTQ